ncbi:hypothetical protein WN51_12158 [Melipona quadrifasciata]|uniref:Uncharacterized protein n=1 Tax=Melipona quadrifasciata TaxID=166423 RepID=A0A0M9A3J0_9HYME|nr:hypothetical protein WN51_12158 [Melipona quadrifasciata]
MLSPIPQATVTNLNAPAKDDEVQYQEEQQRNSVMARSRSIHIGNIKKHGKRMFKEWENARWDILIKKKPQRAEIISHVTKGRMFIGSTLLDYDEKNINSKPQRSKVMKLKEKKNFHAGTKHKLKKRGYTKNYTKRHIQRNTCLTIKSNVQFE